MIRQPTHPRPQRPPVGADRRLLQPGDIVQHPDLAGIACRVRRHQTVPDENTVWTGYEHLSGNLVVVMVGDDQEHIVDPADCTLLQPDTSCDQCGQLGCTHGSRQR